MSCPGCQNDKYIRISGSVVRCRSCGFTYSKSITVVESQIVHELVSSGVIYESSECEDAQRWLTEADKLNTGKTAKQLVQDYNKFMANHIKLCSFCRARFMVIN